MNDDSIKTSILPSPLNLAVNYYPSVFICSQAPLGFSMQLILSMSE